MSTLRRSQLYAANFTKALLLSFFLATSLDAYGAKSCSASASLAFGNYDPTSKTSLSSVGSVNFYCNGNYTVVLKLSAGSGLGATYSGGRRMANGNAILVYNVYTDLSHTRILGDGSGGSVTLSVSGKFGFSRAIYGTILSNQVGAIPGSYADVLVLTVTY